MYIHLPTDPLLPAPFRYSGDVEKDKSALEKHLEEMKRSIEEIAKSARNDVGMGTSQFRIYLTGTPQTTDLEEGQMAICVGQTALFVLASGIRYSAVLL